MNIQPVALQNKPSYHRETKRDTCKHVPHFGGQMLGEFSPRRSRDQEATVSRGFAISTSFSTTSHLPIRPPPHSASFPSGLSMSYRTRIHSVSPIRPQSQHSSISIRHTEPGAPPNQTSSPQPVQEAPNYLTTGPHLSPVHTHCRSTSTPLPPDNTYHRSKLHDERDLAEPDNCQSRSLQPGPTSSYILPRPLPPTSLYK